MKKIFAALILSLFVVVNAEGQCPNRKPGCANWDGPMNVSGAATFTDNIFIDRTADPTDVSLPVDIDITTDPAGGGAGIGIDILCDFTNSSGLATNSHCIKMFPRIFNSASVSGNFGGITNHMYVKYNQATPITAVLANMFNYNAGFNWVIDVSVAHDVTLTQGGNLRLQGISTFTDNVTATHTINNFSALYIEDSVPPDNADGDFQKVAGIWIEDQTAATVDYGIVLDGDNNGTAIHFGDGQDSYIKYDGTNIVVKPDAVGTGGLRINGRLIVRNATITCNASNICTGFDSSISVYLRSGSNGPADVATVADGASGQRQSFYMQTDNGDDIEITPTNFKNGTKITFTTAGQAVAFEFDGTDWFIKSTYGSPAVS